METTMHRPQVGDSVWTSDGNQFAYVKELHGDYFKLDVPMAEDYWLSCTHISDYRDGKVTLKFPRSEADGHKLSEPGTEQPVEATGVISQEDMVDQRERMERELAAQRERLRNGDV